jgi:hypothetical protein
MVQVKLASNYVHDIPIKITSWKKVFEQNDLGLRILDSLANDSADSFKKFILDYGGDSLQHTSDERFFQIHRYICDSLTIAGENESFSNRPLLYFINNKRIDRLHLFILYRKLFNELTYPITCALAKTNFQEYWIPIRSSRSRRGSILRREGYIGVDAVCFCKHNAPYILLG